LPAGTGKNKKPLVFNTKGVLSFLLASAGKFVFSVSLRERERERERNYGNFL